jgi:filamentous hemagglutinin
LLAEKVTAKVAAKAELAGAKATPSGLVSGETGFVDTGKAAANDADFWGAKATGAALESEATGFFGQQRKYWSQEPIQFNGNKVYQRNDLVDPSRVDSQTGLTNLDLMKNGLAPYGPDGKKVNLHHMLQTQDGPIAEVTQSFHQKNSGAIHINSGSDIPSGINRSQFEKWKKDYWRSRANNF